MSGRNAQKGGNFSTDADAVSPAVQDLGNIGGRDSKVQGEILLTPSLFQERHPNFLDPFWSHSYNPANLPEPVYYTKKA